MKDAVGNPKRYRAMSADELAATTAEFDREDVAPATRPLTPEIGAAHERIMAREKNPGGRPVVGEGAERVSVSVERALLRAADDYADEHGMSRSELISVGLRLAMSGKGQMPA